MVRYPTQDEIDAWLAEREKARVAVGVKLIVWSDKNRVLLVKPHHRHNWQLPGGSVELHENPKTAIVREASEELDLELTDTNFHLHDTVLRLDPNVLQLIYIFDSKLPEDQPITIQEAELEAYKFFEPSDVAANINSYYTPFWNQYLASK